MDKAKSNITLKEAVGWYGAVAIILAYFLVSFGLIEAKSLAYQLLNLSGAIGIVIISLQKKVTQSVILNLFWSLIAFLAILKITVF